MKQETRNVFVTDDGKVFDNEADAEAHEKAIRERNRKLASLRVYSVSHSFDDTEGRGYNGKTFLITDADSPVLIQWCLDKFGPPLASWYGDGFFEAWILSEKPLEERDATWAMEQKGKSNGYNRIPTKVAVVSRWSFTEDGLPPSEYPWPRPKETPND